MGELLLGHCLLSEFQGEVRVIGNDQLGSDFDDPSEQVVDLHGLDQLDLHPELQQQTPPLH